MTGVQTSALPIFTVVATGLGRAKQRPQLVPSAQPMLKTGTDDAPAAAIGSRTGAGVGGSAGLSNSGDYGQYDQPAVWRNTREHAAARVSALEESGMDRLEIPAFLRKQAD